MRGITPILSAVLLVAVVLVLAILLYSWYTTTQSAVTPREVLIPIPPVVLFAESNEENVCITVQNPNTTTVPVDGTILLTRDGFIVAAAPISSSSCGNEIPPNSACTLCAEFNVLPGTYEVGVIISGTTATTLSPTPTVSVTQGGAGGADATPPSVSILSPSDGSTVSSTSVTVSFSASDDTNLSKIFVDCDTDGTPETTISLSSNSYSGSYTCTYPSDGSYTITVIAVDTSGNESNDSVSVTVYTSPHVFFAPWPMFRRDLNHSGFFPPSEGVGAGPGVNSLWSFPICDWVESSTSIASSPAIADIDNDGNLEIVIGSDDGNVYAIDTRPS